MKHFILILLILLALSCKKDAPIPDQNKATIPASQSTVKQSIDVYRLDTMAIMQRCAVQFVHDTLQLENMHRHMGDDFYTVADDANFYNAEAAAFLDSVKLPIRYVKNMKFLEFKNNNKESRFVKTDTLSLFNLFLFDPSKALPEPVDITNVREAYLNFSTK